MATNIEVIREMIIHGGDKRLPMPSHSEMKAFLTEYYRSSRFLDRDGPEWGKNYTDIVTQSRLEELEKHGITCVSRFESNRGRSIWFDRSLTVLNPDTPPA